MTRYPWLCTMAALPLLFSGHASSVVEKSRHIAGECRRVFEGEVCVWGVASGNRVIEFGATVPLQVIETAPAHVEGPPSIGTVIGLPDEVRASTGFDHLAMGWEHQGHPPATFLVPHFDFHFYTTTPERVAAIDCTESTKPRVLPANYVLPDITIPEMGVLVGLCVPAMGMHAMDRRLATSPETFEKATLLGYYRATPIFVEPMITKALLLERKDFRMSIPRMVNGEPNVRYPTSFRAEYDRANDQYRLVFSSLRRARKAA